MSEFEFIVENNCEPVNCCPKKKLKLKVDNKGFNLTDQNGYCIINASGINEDGDFGVTTGNYGMVRVSLRGGVPSSYDFKNRYNFVIE